MKTRSLLSLLLLFALTACGTFEVGIQLAPSPIPPATALPGPTQVDLPPTPTPLPPTDTSLPPTDTSLLPTETVLLPTDTESPPAPTQATQMAQIFLIALEDQGVSGKLVGCGDSAVPVQVQIPPTQGVLKAALEALLSVKSQYYGESGLYNALYQSDLQVESVTIKDGKAVVRLSGTLLMGGECDNPRAAAQLEETVLQFPTVTEASIFVNGKPLSEVLSLRG
jgi:Sporulation and spore germination